MSKVVGAALLAALGLAAGLAYYFLVIEAKKKESVKQAKPKKIEEETNGDEQPARAEASKTDEEVPQVDAAAEPPLPAGSPTSLDSFEVPSLPTSDCVLTDSLVIVERHEAEEEGEGKDDHDKHEIVCNVQGEISLDEEFNTFLSSPPLEDAKKASQEEPSDERDEEPRNELEEETKHDPEMVDLEHDKDGPAELTDEKERRDAVEEEPETDPAEVDRENEKDNSADLSDEEEVVSVVEVPPSRPTDESRNLLDKERSDSDPAEGDVKEVAEVLASTVPMESPPQVFNIQSEGELSQESIEDDRGEDLETDAPRAGAAIASEADTNTSEFRDPVQESSNKEGRAFAEQDRRLSEIEIRPENLDDDSDNDDVKGAEVPADDEGVAGVEGATLSEEENATGAGASRDADEGQNAVLEEVTGTVEDTNGKSSSDEKALFDDEVVGKKGKKKNKRKNKRRANGALVNDGSEDATRF